MAKRMPRSDIRNDGAGPYAAFYCDKCNREYRSQPDIGGTIAKDLGRSAVGGFLRNVPILGSVADRALEDQRYSQTMTPQQLDAAWNQVEDRFHECPTCQLIVCPTDWDAPSGFCTEDSPRREDIARAQTEQVAGALKGIAGAFGFGDVMRSAAQGMQSARANMARCPKDGTLAPPGTKFCPECGSAMAQPSTETCPQCSKPVAPGAKFCPECGGKIERAAAAPAFCPSCGAKSEGAKFCPQCGAKLG